MKNGENMKLSIVIPVYNEEKFIDAVLERVRNVKFQQGVEVELVAVDDCSRDGTFEKLKAWEPKGVKVCRHEKNGGKGAALHTGFKLATGDVITVQDSDFEYNPEELPRLLAPILETRRILSSERARHREGTSAPRPVFLAPEDQCVSDRILQYVLESCAQ